MKPALDFDKIRAYFATQPVVKAWLFGSFARGEQTESSDVDFAVVFDPAVKVGLMKHAGIMCDLEDITGRSVDIAPYHALYPLVKAQADKEKILIYERVG